MKGFVGIACAQSRPKGKKKSPRAHAHSGGQKRSLRSTSESDKWEKTEKREDLVQHVRERERQAAALQLPSTKIEP